MQTEQPAPIPNDLPPVWSLVLADMAARDDLGRRRYGVPLQPHNGRDSLRDAYEEALDLVVYLRQAIYERDDRAEALKALVAHVGELGGTLPDDLARRLDAQLGLATPR